MPDSIKCSKCNQEFTDEEAHEIHMNIDHGASEADSFQFIDSKKPLDEQEFLTSNGVRGYNPNPNSDFYNNKIFRKGHSTEIPSQLGESKASEEGLWDEIEKEEGKLDGQGKLDWIDNRIKQLSKQPPYTYEEWKASQGESNDILGESNQEVHCSFCNAKLTDKELNEGRSILFSLCCEKCWNEHIAELDPEYRKPYYGESKASEYSAKFERSAGSMKIGGKPVKKIWESFQGWYWYGIEDQGDGTWYGYVQGFENEWGYFSEDEIKSLGSMAWEVPKSNWEFTGRSDSFESYADEKSGYYTFEAEDDDIDYDKEDKQTMGFIEKQHTEPKKDNNKELDDVDISLDKVEEFYPTKASEAREKSYTTEAKMIEGLEEEYGDFEDSDEEEITETITLRKLGGYSEESIARELHITYGVSHDEALEKVYSVEVSTNDKVAQTFFGKMYKECSESEKAELRMYSGSE